MEKKIDIQFKNSFIYCHASRTETRKIISILEHNSLIKSHLIISPPYYIIFLIIILQSARSLAGLRKPIVKILRKICRHQPRIENSREINLLKYFLKHIGWEVQPEQWPNFVFEKMEKNLKL